MARGCGSTIDLLMWRQGQKIDHEFPEGYSAYWVRAVSDADTGATVTFTYR